MKEEELGVMQLLAGTAGKPRKPGFKHATDSSLETPEGARPSQHVHFGLLTSRTMNKYVFVVFSHQICGTLLQEPQESNKEL